MVDEEEQGDFELTNEQIIEICDFAEHGYQEASKEDLAKALQAVALCLQESVAGEPPLTGQVVDDYYDRIIGQNQRMMKVQIGNATERLHLLGVLKRK